MKSIPIIIDNLKENNNNYHGLKGIIPKDTKIISLGYRQTGYKIENIGKFNCNDELFR